MLSNEAPSSPQGARVLSAFVLKYLGGKGSGNYHHAGRPGERGGSVATGPEGSERTRAQRASETYKPSTAAKQRKAEANEIVVAKIVGGKGTDDNSPMDVTSKIGSRVHGIEVKTLIDNVNNKITMHPASRERKEAWAKSNHATIHTVVVDDRSARRQIYYRRGVGSFRIKSMIPVSNKTHLNALMR